MRPMIRLAALSACVLPLAASAGYFQWEAVELPASTGASCGNGSPYRFFVNRTPFTTKTVVIFEGGGACWDQNACAGKGEGPLGLSILSASNPNGVPADYMTNIFSILNGGLSGVALGGLITPFSARLHPLQSVQTQSWNIVYAPYCTGDVHTGNKVTVYNDADTSTPRTQYHRGSVNGYAMAQWLGKNFKQPERLLVTGFSAGGAGATANYGWVRLAMNPKKSALLADSGPLFQVNRTDSPEVSPSVRLHNKIRDVWGLDGEQGLVTKLLTLYPNAGTAENLGSLSTGLAKIFPQDRLNFSTLQRDGIYSAFSYTSFYPEIAAAPSGVPRDTLLNQKWTLEVNKWVDAMKPYPNVGYYVPYQRDLLKSHTLTTLTFAGTAIKEANISSLKVVVDDLIDGKGTPIRAVETQKNPQNTLTPGVLDWLLQPIYGLLGL
ncbi:pectin acetylesterase-family hydrolase [uncultured Aquabacterium sp.]|uniref:pectin acetylesterase-family hydrolase n=1 Tax=Aquabacterium sp. TaxID=1872578 RepID=UPI0025D79C31|nr:pectin acetylesterase-family hydrolase [uncultured Aquabacterium sp.]